MKNLNKIFNYTLTHFRASSLVALLIAIIFSQLIVYPGQNYAQAQSKNLTLASKISELEAQKEENSKNLASLQSDLEDLTQRAETLDGEISRWQKEIDLANQGEKQAEELKNQFDLEKTRLEAEITVLSNQSRQILLELQKNNLIGWIQIVVSSEDLGEALSKLYTFSSLQAEAEEIQSQLETKLVDKNKSIEGQKVAIKQAENAKAYASSKQVTVDSLLRETQGDQAKYQQLVASEREENLEIERKIASAKARAEAELAARVEARKKAREAEQAERERIAKETGVEVPINSKIDTTGQERLSFSSNFCWYEAPNDLKNAKGFFASPTSGVIQREFDNCSHDAVDISNSVGTEVKSAGKGTVMTATEGGYNGGYGSYVLIKHSLGSDEIAYTLYAHLSKVSVSVGDSVSKGQQIGKMGSSGFSTGSHLHFMIMSGENWGGVGCRIGGAAKCLRPSQYISF